MAINDSGASLHFERWDGIRMAAARALQDVDLIILDLMLWRGSSGYDIFDEIRSNPQYDHVPVVAVSASEPAVALPTARSKGFSGYIAKPIDDEMFEKHLIRILAGEQIWYGGERYSAETS